MAAHDLAEPLRTIGGFADLIQRRYRDQFPAEATPFLDQIVSGVGRMDALIKSLLGYARAADAPPDDQLVMLEPVARAVLSDLRAATEARGATVALDIPTQCRAAGERSMALRSCCRT